MDSEKHHRPRLVIREMILENFKSYAGAQRVGPFHKSFSSVVGPNGSGKSNVIDAMLFVFGKRAKQLRLNKVSELIHNSTHHRNLEMAKVSVFFQEIIDLDDELFEEIPGSEFVISRTAHRCNKSDYYINDRKSNFTEVTALLKGKGIDLDNNRFLILQGEVEQISMMKPKGQTEHETGLLEYLEDIIGTDKYIPMLEESSKKLEELNEKRQSMVTRAKIAERERDGLEADKTAAEAYLSKELECLEAQSVLAQLSAKEATDNVETIQGELTALEGKLAEEKAKRAGFTTALQEQEAKFNAAVAEQATIQKELDTATAEFKEFEKRDIKYREDLKHFKTKLKKLEDKCTKDSTKLESSEKEAADLQAAVPELQKKAEEASGRLGPAEQQLESMMDGIKGEVEGLHQQLRQTRAELAPWEKQMTEVRSRMDVATSERDMLKETHEEAVARLAKAKEDLKAAKESARIKGKQAADMELQVEKLRGQSERAIQKESAAVAEVQRLETSTKEVRGRAEQRRAHASQRASQGAVVAALMDARRAGDVQGIHGRLGDLGAIDVKYDIAASTACPALDYIVVDTTSSAQRCVELLRKKQLGVATFLILEQQRNLMPFLKEKVSPPENIPRLFDMVRCADDRIRLAFYFALRDTLVADDLEQASRIAYSGDKRWRRVVTVKGELINDNGTMSGGGGKPRGGRMRLGNAAPCVVDAAEAAAEIQDAERELASALAALKEAHAAFSLASEEVKASKLALKDLETSIPKVRMEASAAADRAQDLQDQMGQLIAATEMSAEDAKRLQDLEAEIVRDQRELADLKRKSEGLVARVEVLEQSIQNAGGEPLKHQKALVTQLQEEIASAEAEATKKGVQATAAIKQSEKLRKEMTKATAEKEKLVAEQDKLIKELKSLEEAAFKVMEAIKATQEILSKRDAELAIIRVEYEEQQKQMSLIRQVEVDISNDIDTHHAALKEESTKLKMWSSKTSALMATIQERTGQAQELMEEEALAMANAEELHHRVAVLEEEMSQMDVNPEAIAAWKNADAEYGSRVAELEAATAERDAVRKEHEDLRKRRLDEFMAGFNVISLKLKEMYQMITLGGDAELELVDSLDPFSEGILFSVRPPKKSWKNIANLSGGEKTLSSLSLVFALHHYKPTPLYVMDEIDAALDFKNVSIVGHYIKERTKNAQFVIISLRNNMFELADRLVGIYKTENATKSVAINPGQFVVGNVGSSGRQRVLGSIENNNSKGVDNGMSKQHAVEDVAEQQVADFD